MALRDVVKQVKAVLAKLQASPFYPDRKVINGAVAGAVAAVVAAVGLSASPLVAAVVVLVVAEVTAFLSKPADRDVRKRTRAHDNGRNRVIDRDKVK